MNARKCGFLYLSMLLFEIACLVSIVFLPAKFKITPVGSLILSQLIVFIPCALFLLITGQNPVKLIQHRRIKIGTIFLVLLFTLLCLPLIQMTNLISMLFVENEVASMQGLFTSIPAWELILIVCIIGPMNEEFICRGVFYHGLKKNGGWIQAMLLSAVIFGLLHMNFNQMSYAIVMGVIGVLLIEATGSIYSSFIMHFLVNLPGALSMVFSKADNSAVESSKRMIEETMHMPYKSALMVMISGYAVVVFITGSLAVCVFYLILKVEGRKGHMKDLWEHKKGKQSVLSVPMVIAIVITLGWMIVENFVLK